MKKSKRQSLRQVLSKEDQLLKENEVIIKKLDRALRKDKNINQKRLEELKHFQLNDFFQAMVGALVFSFAAIIDNNFHEETPFLSLTSILGMHFIILFAAALALNYRFRDNLAWNKLYGKLFAKRVVWTYLSVAIVMIPITYFRGLMEWSFTTEVVFKYLVNDFSLGLIGAFGFNFIRNP